MQHDIFRYTRKTQNEHKDLRLVAAGQGAGLKASPMFKSFPPKVGRSLTEAEREG